MKILKLIFILMIAFTGFFIPAKAEAQAIDFYYLKYYVGKAKYGIKDVTVINNAEYILTEHKGNGNFVIWVSASGGEQLFIQYWHEEYHMINPDVYDIYAEGNAVYYSSVVAKHHHIDYEDWNKYFRDNYANSAYAAPYFMIAELQGHGYRTFQMIYYVNPDGRTLNINKWLYSTKNPNHACSIIAKRWNDLLTSQAIYGQNAGLMKPFCIK